MEKIYTYEKDFKDFVDAKVNPGTVFRIDEEMFYYWLEVLPPVYMDKVKLINGIEKRCSFGFAEGYEPVMDFFTEVYTDPETGKKETRFYCCQSKRMNAMAFC